MDRKFINFAVMLLAFGVAERKRSGKVGGFDSAVQSALSEQLAKRGIK